MPISEIAILIFWIVTILFTHLLSSSIQDPINKAKNGKPYIKSKSGQKDFVHYRIYYAIEMLGMAVTIFVYAGAPFL